LSSGSSSTACGKREHLSRRQIASFSRDRQACHVASPEQHCCVIVRAESESPAELLCFRKLSLLDDKMGDVEDLLREQLSRDERRGFDACSTLIRN